MADGRLRKNNSSFTSGVFILGLSAIIVKIIGLVYKIPMLRLLGSEGMGYFNSAYELYAMLCTVSTTGLPVAMSVMISSARARGKDISRSIFKVSMRLFLIVGLVGSAALFAFAHPLSDFLKSENAVWSIMAISPTVLFICVTSAYRGYFQGLGRMAPTAISQIIEATLKLALGILFAWLALSCGLETEAAAALAVLGLVAGVAVSALCLAFIKLTSDKGDALQNQESSSNASMLAQLMRIAIPVTLSSTVMSLTKVIDMSAILRRLQSIGYSSAEAVSAYGSYTTLALPLFSLAPALVSSVAMPLVPSLSAAISKGDEAAQTEAVTRAASLTMLLAFPISIGLVLFPTEILEMIFSGEDTAIALTAPLLAILGAAVPLSCLITVGNATLQAYSLAHVPIISMLFGAGAKLVLAFCLIGNERIGITGAPVSTFLCDLIINAINLAVITKCVPQSVSMSKTLVKPFVAALLSVGAVRVIYVTVSDGVGDKKMLTLAAIIASAVLYGIIAMIIGAVDKKEIKASLLWRRQDT